MRFFTSMKMKRCSAEHLVLSKIKGAFIAPFFREPQHMLRAGLLIDRNMRQIWLSDTLHACLRLRSGRHLTPFVSVQGDIKCSVHDED